MPTLSISTRAQYLSAKRSIAVSLDFGILPIFPGHIWLLTDILVPSAFSPAFFPALPNEIKFRQNLERHVHRAEEMGFLRPAAGREDAYEVQPLLRSFINAEWLHTFDDRLQEYLEYGQKELTEGEDSDGLI